MFSIRTVILFSIVALSKERNSMETIDTTSGCLPSFPEILREKPGPMATLEVCKLQPEGMVNIPLVVGLLSSLHWYSPDESGSFGWTSAIFPTGNASLKVWTRT